MQHESVFRTAVLIPIILLASAASAAELSIVVQPNHTPERSKQVYQPLLEYLNTTTGHTFNLLTPRDFHDYWIRIQEGEKPDLVIDEAHLTDFRIKRDGYIPLARVAENVSYSLLTTDNYTDETTEVFVGRKIVTMPAPSLGYLVLAEVFNNPMAQPDVSSSAQSWGDGIEIVFAREAEAAMSPSWLWASYPNLHPVFTSETFPGMTVSAGPEVDVEVREAIKQALLSLHEQDEHYAALDELNTSQFVPTRSSDYKSYSKILRLIYNR